MRVTGPGSRDERESPGLRGRDCPAQGEKTDWKREDDDDNRALAAIQTRGQTPGTGKILLDCETGPDPGRDGALNWKMEPEIASYGESLTREEKKTRKYFNEAQSALTED